MSTEENKALVRRYIEEAYNKGNLAVVDELIAADHQNHAASPDDKPGIEGEREFVRWLRVAWPDIRDIVEVQVAEDDKVVTRCTSQGTHTQTVSTEFGSIAPTNKQVTVTWITIDRISGGKIVETWRNQDDLGVMQQLGAIPQMAQGGA